MACAANHPMRLDGASCPHSSRSQINPLT
jgi:hypothetical protein